MIQFIVYGAAVPDTPPVNEIEVAKILMQDYRSAREEVLLHIQLYKTPQRNGAILIALVGLSFPLLANQNITLGNIQFHSTPWTDLGIVFTISTIAFLMEYSALAVLFALQVLAERCVHLEDEINKCLRGPYLIWERFAHQIWSINSDIKYKMPDAVAGVLFHVLVLSLSVVFPFIVLTKILCGTPDIPLKVAVSVYIFYLLAFPMYGFYVNVYTMGPLRAEIRQLMEGKALPPSRSGLGAFLIIGVVAGAIALAFVFIELPYRKNVCAYVGPISAPAIQRAWVAQGL